MPKVVEQALKLTITYRAYYVFGTWISHQEVRSYPAMREEDYNRNRIIFNGGHDPNVQSVD